MSGFLPLPQFAPCPECGEALAPFEVDGHECDEELWLDYQMELLRHHVGRFEWDLLAWLKTPHGQFAAYWAVYDRTRGQAESLAAAA
jgi:hypothetical protein